MYNVFRFILLLGLLILFYGPFKQWLFQRLPSWVTRLRHGHEFPFVVWVGAVELGVVAVLHAGFTAMLLWWYQIPILSLFTVTFLTHVGWGAVMGAGLLGLSVLCCTVMITLLPYCVSTPAPSSEAEWASLTQAGWLRHHRYTFRCFPLWLALLILILQVGSEEIIFRVIVPLAGASVLPTLAPTMAVLLFVFMQRFHMPCWLSAAFPMIGALLMGVLHQYCYSLTPEVLPLVVSHVVFFLVSLYF